MMTSNGHCHYRTYNIIMNLRMLFFVQTGPRQVCSPLHLHECDDEVNNDFPTTGVGGEPTIYMNLANADGL